MTSARAMSKKKKLKLLFCTNDRGDNKLSCAAVGANSLRRYAKEQCADRDDIKIKKSGCLGLCKHGPVIEAVPSKIYYRCTDKKDIDLMLASLDDPLGASHELIISTRKSSKK
jgi:(2Fe-2S) ferredoxin